MITSIIARYKTGEGTVVVSEGMRHRPVENRSGREGFDTYYSLRISLNGKYGDEIFVDYREEEFNGGIYQRIKEEAIRMAEEKYEFGGYFQNIEALSSSYFESKNREIEEGIYV